jgi:hypothetical protein
MRPQDKDRGADRARQPRKACGLPGAAKINQINGLTEIYRGVEMQNPFRPPLAPPRRSSSAAKVSSRNSSTACAWDRARRGC